MRDWEGNRTDEIDALHYLLTAFKEDWKAASICFAALFLLGGAGVLFTLKTTYSSRVVLPLTPSVEALVKTEAVLDPVLRSPPFAGQRMPIEEARKELAEIVSVSPELVAGSGVRVITVPGETPERAHAILQELLDSVLAASVPRGTSRELLLERINNQTTAIANLKALADALVGNAKTVKGGSEGEQYSRAMVSLVSDIAVKENELGQSRSNLRGMQPGDVIVPPTIATQSNPKHLLAKLTVVTTLAIALTTAFVILLNQRRRRYSLPKRAMLSLAARDRIATISSRI
jgi:hypothetical protein